MNALRRTQKQTNNQIYLCERNREKTTPQPEQMDMKNLSKN